MKKYKGGFSLFLLLLSCIIMLTGCTILEEESIENSWEHSTEKTAAEAEKDMNDPPMKKEVQLTKKKGKRLCNSYEKEVEPGICSYVVDCKNTKTCEAWAEKLIWDMEEKYDSLTYSEEWDFDEQMLRKSKEDVNVLATYPVKGNKSEIDLADEDEEYYASLWDRFAWIIPSKERTMVSRYEVFEHVELMAYVIQDEEEYENWTYAVNVEQASFETERVLTDIHEFGHLLALNAAQINPYKIEKNCKTYMWEEGCANKGAYMYKFYQQFWESGDVEDEDDFVSEYAMNDVYEDFAESWSHFVVTPRPEGNSILDKKILFFYDYDELIMLRAEILGRTASWLDRNTDNE